MWSDVPGHFEILRERFSLPTFSGANKCWGVWTIAPRAPMEKYKTPRAFQVFITGKLSVDSTSVFIPALLE
jgi:hypothetical protein